MEGTIYTVYVIQDVISRMKVLKYPVEIAPNNYFQINYEPGTDFNVVKALIEKDNSITQKGLKYPLIALMMPFEDNKGLGNYTFVRIPKIIFATLQDKPMSSILSRYEAGGTYKEVLYPLVDEFINQLCRSIYTNSIHRNSFPYKHLDCPCLLPAGEGLNDFLDTIEIHDLEVNIVQTKNC